MAERMVTLERSTNETQIELTLDLDGTGRYEIDRMRLSEPHAGTVCPPRTV